MAIEIQVATADDAAGLTNIGELAFKNDLHHTTMINYVDATPEQLVEYKTWRVERTRARISKPGSHWFKAVDTETGELAGLTAIMEPAMNTPTQPEDRPEYPHMVNKEILEERMAIIDRIRGEVMGDRKDYWYIPAMAVHPGYQRRGVGQALLKANTDLADAAGGDTYLESRPDAVRLYLSAGFEQIAGDAS